MNTRFLVPMTWTLWGILVITLLYGMVRVSTDRSTSPEAGRGLGVLVVGALLVVVLIAGGVLYMVMRKQSSAGLATMAVMFAFPTVLLVASPLVGAFKERRFASDYASVGDFAEPALAAMAQAIAANDTATLSRLLTAKAPPLGTDRAGNDLLAYALIAARDRQGSSAPVKVLLDAGADPRQTKMGGGTDVLNFMVLGITPVGREIVGLLLDHRADPNLRDPTTGVTPLGAVSDDPEVVRMLVEHGADMNALQNNGITPLVSFISQRQWESALYLINKGANLDVKNADGLSVDYYLNDWKDSVYGEHPEGWDRVRAAIAARRTRTESVRR